MPQAIEPPTTVVVLDLDDTLYLERDYALSGFSAVGAWLLERHGIIGFADEAERQFAAGNHRRVFDATLAALAVDPRPGLIAELVGVYRAHRPDIRLLGDAERFIGMRPAGRALALLTDGFLVVQRNKVEALGLSRCTIWPIVFTDEWGAAFWKPHRRSYESVERCFACDASLFIYVADNPAKDFIAPRALGWRTVQIRREHGIYRDVQPRPGQGADVVIESLDDLTDTAIADLLGTRRKG